MDHRVTGVSLSLRSEDGCDRHRAGSLRCLLLGEGPLNHQWLEASGGSRTVCPHSTQRMLSEDPQGRILQNDWILAPFSACLRFRC